MAKRATRTNAETLNNVRKQAEERGRHDVVVELHEMMQHGTRASLRDLRVWLEGYIAGQSSVCQPDETLGYMLLAVRTMESVADAVLDGFGEPF